MDSSLQSRADNIGASACAQTTHVELEGDGFLSCDRSKNFKLRQEGGRSLSSAAGNCLHEKLRR
eukprot:456676-Pyramimonas_sp.AAC.1